MSLEIKRFLKYRVGRESEPTGPPKRHLRRFAFLLALALVCAFNLTNVAGAQEIDLMQGSVRKGGVPILERGGFRYAALDQMLTNLGLAASPVSGGLVAVYSEKKIEFWSGSNIARVNGTVMPLLATVFYEDGHWWGEADSSLRALSQFLASTSRPHDLSWSTSRGGAPSAGNIEPAPGIARPEAGARSTPAPRSSITVTKVRWGEQADCYRAVVDISSHTEVELKESPGAVDVIFSGASVDSFSENSPWGPLKVKSGRSGANAVLSFTHAASRVRSFWLQDPPRYVVDFYFQGVGTPDAPADLTRPPQTGTTPPIKTVPPAAPSQTRQGRFLVVVDAGHGGRDPGAVGNSLKEKDINLKAAIELANSIKNTGMDVKLTRADDRYLKLGERTLFANNAKADVFISLHCNALPRGQHASGVEFYLMDQPTDRAAFNLAVLENKELEGETHNVLEENANSDRKTQLLMKILIDMQQNDKLNESTTLAEFMYNRTRSAGYSLRKVRQAPLFVLRGAEMPALLVEMGYITEAKDAKNLNSQAFRKKMMDAIALGISDYLKNGPSEGGT
ncbi:MAG: N-acetylmuramoyl-L-alanine amidase [Synergistaceae bacterium]|nr:N-acetylmuramoyl-L-alanine amidase [Synergistaceae bacterium]